MSSRLFQEVREKLGLVYSIYSYITSHADSGALAVYAGTSRDHLDEVIAIIMSNLSGQHFKTKFHPSIIGAAEIYSDGILYD